MDTKRCFCLQKEWHHSRGQLPTGGLGYPKYKFVDNGQARPQRETVQKGNEEDSRIRDRCPDKGSGQNRTQMYSPAPILAAADFILSQYIRLPDKVKLRVSSGSLPERNSRCQHVLSFVCC